MIRTLAFLIVAALAVAGAVWFAERPGMVVLDWQDRHIEAPVGVVAIAVVLIAIASALVYRLWRAIRRAPHAMAAASHRRRREKGYRALTQGMVAVAAGDADEARRQAREADKLLHEPPLTMLLSAQAAQLNGDEAAARDYFTAMLERPETSFLGLRGLLMQAQRAGDRAAALGLAQRAYAAKPKTPWVLTTLFDLQAKSGRWRDALATLEQAIRRGAVDPAEGRRRMAVVLLACSREAEDAGDRDAALGFAQKAHKQADAFLPAALREIALLLETGHKRRAAGRIADAWARTPHPELVRLHARLEDDADAIGAVKRVEKLASHNPDHAESHIALAEALLAARLWGAARTHLDKAGGTAPSARVCRLMSALEEGESGDIAAGRRWLLAAARAEPDPAWICSACGAQSGAWTPLCPRCEALGSLEWRVAPRTQTIEAAPATPALPAGAPPPAGTPPAVIDAGRPGA